MSIDRRLPILNNRPPEIPVSPIVSKTLNIATSAVAFTLLHSFCLSQTTKPLMPPCTPAATQLNSVPPQTPAPCRKKLYPKTSISLGAFPQLTATRIVTSPYNFITESLSPSAGVLGTVRQSFSPWLGYSVNMGYTRASERGTDNAGVDSSNTASNFTIPANVYEFSLSYLAERHVTPRLSAFADVGAGMLAFLPFHSGAATIADAPNRALAPNVNYRPLGVAGFGIDYCLTGNLSIRAEYRGQLYKFADYGNALPRYLTVTSEPTISLVYNFNTRRP